MIPKRSTFHPLGSAAPLNIALRTLHVDRLRLHRNLLGIAGAHGVTIVHDRVTGIERNGRAITAVRTALGQRVASNWFIDASGSASSFLGREFELPLVDCGPKKVAMWAHFKPRNGVTAALRHAAEASKLISRFKHKQRFRAGRRRHNLRVLPMGKFFYSLIEKLVYDSPIGDRMGLLSAGNVYTIPAWSINQLYSSILPNGLVSTVVFNLFLGLLRSIAWSFYRLCKLFPFAPCTLHDSGA